MPPKKCIPKIGANIGAITGILLIQELGLTFVSVDIRLGSRLGMVLGVALGTTLEIRLRIEL
jgi:hypothetical protein